MTRDEELRQAAAHDHARAGERGERCRQLANDIISQLLAAGILRDPRQARILAFHAIATELYSGRAIDIPGELGQP